MALVFYYKDMLEKVTMQRTQQFSAFACYRENPVKRNACAVVRKIETDCFSRNVRFLTSLRSKRFRGAKSEEETGLSAFCPREKMGREQK